MIDGHIAGTARDLVKKQITAANKHAEESAYRSLCEGLPVLLRTAGLARTVAFLDAKGGEHAVVLEHIRMQLQGAGIYSDAKTRSLNLGEWITTGQRSAAEYRHVSTLALRIAFWHKRLAQALLRKRGE